MAINNIDIQDEKGNSYRPMANPDSISEFTKAATRTNIASGDTHRTIFGKICKFFADLGSSAFSGLANNLTTTAAGYGMDARQGPVIQQQFDQINSNLIALNDGGAIKGMDAREDGVYITYVPTAGADAVTKKCSGVDKYNNVSGVRVSWREIYFNIAALRDDYQALSLDSICVQLLKISPNGQENPVFNYSYNASTGRLTITTVSDMFGVITGMVANIWVSP